MLNSRFNMSAARCARIIVLLAGGLLWAAAMTWARSGAGPQIPNIFAPQSTPAREIYVVSMFVTEICVGIFVVVFGLLAYSVVKFRQRAGDDHREPPQVYGSKQLELAWTVIPVLIVVVLFLSTARVLHEIQDAPPPAGAVQVTVVGHQFWWEFRYPQFGFVTANELHVPVSDPKNPTPTYLTLLSADVNHSFWVPRLAGKTDLIPNRANHMWIEPLETGLYLGQCAQYCGTQHAKMLLRVYVDTPAQFDRWVQKQKLPAWRDASVTDGRRVFTTNACVNCHTVTGTGARGRFGPDLTHLMSRDTLASGAAPNNPGYLRLWVQNPDAIKPGALMPAMNLSDEDLDRVTAYLLTLR